MEKVKKNSIPNDKKLVIIVAVCLVAMIGLILGIMLSVKVSIFASVSDVYTLSKDYKITQEDIDQIGKGDGTLGLDYACIINLNGHTLDLDGYTFGMASNEEGKSIKVINGTIKNGNFVINAEKCGVVLDKINFACDYKVNAKNSLVSLENLSVDAAKINVVGGELYLDSATVSGNIELKSDLTVNDSVVPSVTAVEVTSVIRGTLNGTLNIGNNGIITSYANVEKVEANDGSKITLAKISGGKNIDILGGNAKELNVNGSSNVIVENCANVDVLNINSISNIQVAGTAGEMNVNEAATVETTKSAIIEKVNINAPANVQFGGSTKELNVNKNASLNIGGTAYIKFLNLNNSAEENAKLTFDGKAAVITVQSEKVDLAFSRDAEVAYIIKSAAFAYTKNSAFAVKEMMEVEAMNDDVTLAANQFIMPITYVNSDCQGDGFIDYSAGGTKGAVDIIEEDLNKVGHSYVYKIIQRPTSEETGIGRYTCECGDCYDVVLPIRKVVLDAPTLFDLLGMDVKAGVYNFAIDDGTYYAIDTKDFGGATSVAETAGTNFVAFVNKAYIQATVERDNILKEVRLYGDAQLDVQLYMGITDGEKEKLFDPSLLEEGEKAVEPTIAITVQAIMRQSKIYVYYDIDSEEGSTATTLFDAYDKVNALLDTYLSSLPIDISLEDLVRIVNAAIKIDNLTSQYETATEILINKIYNSTNFGKLLPALDCVEENDGVYSLNVADLFTQLDKFGSQTLAQYIDGLYGRGTVSSVLDFADGILDLYVNDIWDAIVVFASNADMDEAMVIEDANTLLSCITDDILVLLSDEDKESVEPYLQAFYDEELEIYTIEYALNNYGDYTIFEVINGKLADNPTTEEIDAFDDKKAEMQEKVSTFVAEIEDTLYASTLYDLIPLITSGRIEAQSVKDIVKANIEDADLYTIEWTLTEEDELSTIALFVENKNYDPTNIECTADPYSFALKYDVVNKDLSKLYYKVRMPRLGRLFIDYDVEEGSDILVDIADIISFKYNDKEDYNLECYVYSPYNGAIIIGFELHDDAESTNIELGWSITPYAVLGTFHINAEFTKIVDEANTECKCECSYEDIKSFFDDFKFKSIEEIYNDFKASYSKLVAELDVNVIEDYYYNDPVYEVLTRSIVLDDKDNFSYTGYSDNSKGTYDYVVDLSTLKDGYVFVEEVGEGEEAYCYHFFYNVVEDGRAVELGYVESDPLNSDYNYAGLAKVSIDNGISYDWNNVGYFEAKEEEPVEGRTYFVIDEYDYIKATLVDNKFAKDTTYYYFDAIETYALLKSGAIGSNIEYVNGFELTYNAEIETYLFVEYQDFGLHVKKPDCVVTVSKDSFIVSVYEKEDFFLEEGETIATPEKEFKFYYDTNAETEGIKAEYNRKKEYYKKCDSTSVWDKNIWYYNNETGDTKTVEEAVFNANKDNFLYAEAVKKNITGVTYLYSATEKFYYDDGDTKGIAASGSVDPTKTYYKTATSREAITEFTFTYWFGHLIDITSYGYNKANKQDYDSTYTWIKIVPVEVDENTYELNVTLNEIIVDFITNALTHMPYGADFDFAVRYTVDKQVVENEEKTVVTGLSIWNLSTQFGLTIKNLADEFSIEYGELEVFDGEKVVDNLYVITEDKERNENKFYFIYDVESDEYNVYLEELKENVVYYEIKKYTFADLILAEPEISIWTNKDDSCKLYFDLSVAEVLVENNYNGTTGFEIEYAGGIARVLVNETKGTCDIYMGTSDKSNIIFSLLVEEGESDYNKIITLVYENETYELDATYDEATNTYKAIYEEKEYILTYKIGNNYAMLSFFIEGEEVVNLYGSYEYSDISFGFEFEAKYFNSNVKFGVSYTEDYSDVAIKAAKEAGKDYTGFAEEWPEEFGVNNEEAIV